MPELNDEELDALVGEATVDAYGDDEQLSGFAVTGVSDDDLLAKLRGLEVNAEREELGAAMRRSAVRRGNPQRAAQAA
jgi:hypothetical protein